MGSNPVAVTYPNESNLSMIVVVYSNWNMTEIHFMSKIFFYSSGLITVDATSIRFKHLRLFTFVHYLGIVH